MPLPQTAEEVLLTKLAFSMQGSPSLPTNEVALRLLKEVMAQAVEQGKHAKAQICVLLASAGGPFATGAFLQYLAMCPRSPT